MKSVVPARKDKMWLHNLAHVGTYALRISLCLSALSGDGCIFISQNLVIGIDVTCPSIPVVVSPGTT